MGKVFHLFLLHSIMKEIIIEIGNTFGKWTVISKGSTYFFNCKCECGTIRAVSKYSLFHGKSKNCGCVWVKLSFKSKDISNRIFGKLEAIRPVGRDAFKNILWLCECSCGNTNVVSATRLIQGTTKSCGCGKYDGIIILPFGEAAFNSMIAKYRRTANENGRTFSLTKEQFYSLTQQPCAYCGCDAKKKYSRSNLNGNFYGNGVDRVDNNEGYTEVNSVPCCETCNRAKRSMSIDEFKHWVESIYMNLFKLKQAI